MLQIKQPPANESLVDMFKKQRELMKWYIVREGLPQYPLDLTMRANQKLLKSFAYRIIEELGEASENLYMAFNCISTNHSEEAFVCLERYNEELADVWHFMLETMIFSGMDEYGVSEWISTYTRDHPQFGGILDRNNLLGGFLKFAEFLNQQDGKPYQKDRNQFRLMREADAIKEPWNMGGRLLSDNSLENHDQFFWHISYKLTMAMNCLKTRDWHTQSEATVNIIQFSKTLMDTFIVLIRLMVYTGKTELGIYNSYVIKNKINHERKEQKT